MFVEAMADLEKDMDTKFANDKHRMLANIVFTGNWIVGGFEKFIKAYGLSSQQFNILRILKGANEWLTMNEIKSRMVEKSPNATRLCDKLVDKNLLLRSRSEEDRRVVHLKITNEGVKLLEKIDKDDNGNYAKFVENVSDKEAALVGQILDKLRG